MKLDIGTIAFISTLVFTAQAIAVYIQYKVNNYYHGLGWWLIGSCMQALGFILMLTLNMPALHDLAMFANPCVFIGQVLLYIGITKFHEKPVHLWIPLSLCFSYFLVYFFFIFISNSIFARSLVVSISSVIISLLTTYSIFRVDKKHLMSAAKFTASIFFIYAMLETAMTFSILVLPPLASFADLSQVPIRIISFLLPLLGSILWTFGFIIMVNQRLNMKINNLLSEKELILKEVHHRIKNNMNTIASLLSLQGTTLSDKTAITALYDAGNRIQSMSMLYDKLYRSADFMEISVKDYLPALIDEVISNFPNCNTVKIETCIDDFILEVKRLQPLGIIINELLTNIMKYAFVGKTEGMIIVSATNIHGHVYITIQDDGSGIPESVSFENSTGFGLQLVHALTQQLDGTIRIERGNGTKVVLEFEI